ncbi:MAG TPA: OmpH family outer membrane protein [bacterium]|jgi:Skp family chaperone for outer membrane proteins
MHIGGRFLHGAVLVLVALAILAAGCSRPRAAVVDSDRVINESVLALAFQKQLSERERAMAEDLRLLAPQLSAQDLEARRQLYMNELQKMKQDLEKRLTERIREVVAEVAAQRRLKIVFVKDATPYGGEDITQDIIAKLK